MNIFALFASISNPLSEVNYTKLLSTFSVEATLVVGAIFVLMFDLIFLKKETQKMRAVFATFLGLGIVAIAYCFANANVSFEPVTKVGDMIVTHEIDLGKISLVVMAAVKHGILILTALTLLLIGAISKLRNPAEQVATHLFATVGFTLMVTADNLLVIFLALELASLSLYILAGFDKTKPESAEAALKYFLYGSVAAAFLLFGFSLLYGITGEIELTKIKENLAPVLSSPLLFVTFLMVLVGFAYKAAAAPFHLWAPDAYQGAPVTSAALIASGSKIAGFILLTRFITFGCRGTDSIVIIIAIIAAVSLLLGNIAALVQTNVRRLLAYSAIAHAGVLFVALIPFSVTWGIGVEMLLNYYLFTYGLATIGAFGVIAVIENATGKCEFFSDFRGLWHRSPFLTITLCIFVLSLAGVPPLAGFYAKFFAFWLTFKIGSGELYLLFWLALLAIGVSAIALYYYLKILKAAFVAEPDDEKMAPIETPSLAKIALSFAAVLLIVLGIFPNIFFM